MTQSSKCKVQSSNPLRRRRGGRAADGVVVTEKSSEFKVQSSDDMCGIATQKSEIRNQKSDSRFHGNDKNQKLCDLPPVSEMMRDAGLEPKKQFGQNFLFDLNLTSRIARSVPNITTTPVVEVGPGPAGLTRALLMAGAPRVIAIEKDHATGPILSRVADASGGRLAVIYDDAMRVDFAALGVDEYAICANLPYNVGTALLIGWLERIAAGAPIKSMTLMFQREVAERIVAAPRSSAYGRLGVLVALIADARILFDVPNTAFFPRPRVQSAVVQIIPNHDKIAAIENLGAIEHITAKLFGQRRKMIRAIMPGVDWAQFGLTGTERAEQLPPNVFAQMARVLV